jgi:succinylglutamate desuccinylase
MNYKINSFNKDKKPVIAVVGCIHGDELVGQKIILQLRKMKIKKGTLITIIANEKAMKKKKRFIEQDLNRSFPGKSNGNHEERLAHSILKITKKADFVIDIHSTTTDVKNLAIITKKDKDTLDLAYSLEPRRIILMKKDIAKKSFINYCKVGVSLEYGKDNSSATYDNAFNSIIFLLEKEKMVDDKRIKSKRKCKKIDYYKMKGVAKKMRKDVLMKNVKNFKLIKKGDVFAMRNRKKLIAEDDFYPVLFGESAYDNIFGFKAIMC